ncbi:uncharacterized protein V6R79_007057 [Siganus canaliculatus]
MKGDINAFSANKFEESLREKFIEPDVMIRPEEDNHTPPVDIMGTQRHCAESSTFWSFFRCCNVVGKEDLFPLYVLKAHSNVMFTPGNQLHEKAACQLIIDQFDARRGFVWSYFSRRTLLSGSLMKSVCCLPTGLWSLCNEDFVFFEVEHSMYPSITDIQSIPRLEGGGKGSLEGFSSLGMLVFQALSVRVCVRITFTGISLSPHKVGLMRLKIFLSETSSVEPILLQHLLLIEAKAETMSFDLI